MKSNFGKFFHSSIFYRVAKLFSLKHVVLRFQLVAASARKKLPGHSWNWEPLRARILSLIASSLEINLELLFGSSDPDEGYLSFITK